MFELSRTCLWMVDGGKWHITSVRFTQVFFALALFFFFFLPVLFAITQSLLPKRGYSTDRAWTSLPVSVPWSFCVPSLLAGTSFCQLCFKARSAVFVFGKTGAGAACISMLAEKTTALKRTESRVAMKGEVKRGWERVCISTVKEETYGSMYWWKGWHLSTHALQGDALLPLLLLNRRAAICWFPACPQRIARKPVHGWCMFRGAIPPSKLVTAAVLFNFHGTNVATAPCA